MDYLSVEQLPRVSRRVDPRRSLHLKSLSAGAPTPLLDNPSVSICIILFLLNAVLLVLSTVGVTIHIMFKQARLQQGTAAHPALELYKSE